MKTGLTQGLIAMNVDIFPMVVTVNKTQSEKIGGKKESLNALLSLLFYYYCCISHGNTQKRIEQVSITQMTLRKRSFCHNLK